MSSVNMFFFSKGRTGLLRPTTYHLSLLLFLLLPKFLSKLATYINLTQILPTTIKVYILKCFDSRVMFLTVGGCREKVDTSCKATRF